MPLSAIQNVEVDHIVRTDEIAPLLQRAAIEGLQKGPPKEARSKLPMPSPMQKQALLEEVELGGVQPDAVSDPPTFYSCPECGGTTAKRKTRASGGI